MGGTGSRPSARRAGASEPELETVTLGVIGDDSVRGSLVDRLGLGPTKRPAVVKAHPEWETPGGPGPLVSLGAVAARVWTLPGGRQVIVRAYDSAPSAARPPHPPTAVVEDCDTLILAIADPAIPAARALSGQAARLAATVAWARAHRAGLGLPEPRVHIVYCSNQFPPRPTGLAVAGSSARAGSSTLVQPGSAAAEMPAPVMALAVELGCQSHSVKVDDGLGVGALVSACVPPPPPAFPVADRDDDAKPGAAAAGVGAGAVPDGPEVAE